MPTCENDRVSAVAAAHAPRSGEIVVRVTFFGRLSDGDASGKPMRMPAGATVGDLARLIEARRPDQEFDGVMVARNAELVAMDAALANGDELAFLPPVSGG